MGVGTRNMALAQEKGGLAQEIRLWHKLCFNTGSQYVNNSVCVPREYNLGLLKIISEYFFVFLFLNFCKSIKFN